MVLSIFYCYFLDVILIYEFKIELFRRKLWNFEDFLSRTANKKRKKQRIELRNLFNIFAIEEKTSLSTVII